MWTRAQGHRRLLVGVALAALLAGCGGDGVDTDQPAADGRRPFSFDVAFRSDDPLVVVVRYNDLRDCPREQVEGQVQESSGEVVVTLTRLAQNKGTCGIESIARDATLELEQPLGDRSVVDGATGNDIAVAVGTPPGPAGSPVELQD